MPLVPIALAAVAMACANGNEKDAITPFDAAGFDAGGFDATSDVADSAVPAEDTQSTFDVGLDVKADTGPIDPDAACASTAVTAKVDVLPVDIIWVVDNSSSMEPAVAQVKTGLNDFAAKIAAKSLDYKVIMLAIRNKTSPLTLGGGTRYPVCIPAPLAGDDNCGNGPRFFHTSVDIFSTQPLEQILGTLGQTAGYKVGESRGGDLPWADQLRKTATKTFVIVTDDDSRLSATEFETFAGGKNPFNSNTLPPGILDPSWTAITGGFDGYSFSGIYGWGSLTDPSVVCKFTDGTSPAKSGATYTTLVTKTGGVRAKLCDGAAAWGTFFDAIATSVVKTSKLACDLEIPLPATGTLDPSQVNVRISSGGKTEIIPKVKDAAACGTDAGWYYDDDLAPKRVFLCPAACTKVNTPISTDKNTIEVLFGCKTITIIK
ncbi:MAG: hypothetical protein ABI175_02685 [Polyangiales bacterium]